MLITLIIFYSLSSFASLRSAAFFYGPDPPFDQLRAFDVVVVNPETSIHPIEYNTGESELFAYVSVGEVNPAESYYNQLSPSWLIGANPTWQAKIVDQTQVAWRTFFLDHIITPLWEKGYRGFFLDTLDSYQLPKLSPEKKLAQVQGILQLIKAIKQKYPDAKLILNRGFELLPTIHALVYAVAAESLFASWNQKTSTYEPVPTGEREALLKELKIAQGYNLPIIIIDYLPPKEHLAAMQLAKKISALGMIPWVTDGQLKTLGVGSVTPIVRKILIIYTKEDSTPPEHLFDPAAFLLLDAPLNYLGYLTEYHDANEALPENISTDNYAGIIIWAEPKTDARKQQLHDWAVMRLSEHIPLFFMHGFGFEPTQKALKPFGLILSDIQSVPKSIRVSKQDQTIVGFEIKPFPARQDFIPITAKNSTVLLQWMDEKGHREDAIAITPWGGYILEPYGFTEMPNGQSFWIIDPYKWLPRVLRLQTFPVPDVTTENGTRLMFVHIDGDGFPSHAEWDGGRYAPIEVKENILKRFPVPTTVSVVTGDIAKNGLYPALTPAFETIARDIFSMPFVEVASHTFSHPFNWINVLNATTSGKYNLPIPNYVFNAETEVAGSADYINHSLVPKGKYCKVLLWSGYANINEYELSQAFKANLANLNGGETHLVSTFPSLTSILPVGRQQGPYFQVYAPISNEEYYTNVWSGPFYGYMRVIDTFKLTDSPRRFKPIDIYYHFYSGSKLASIKALEKVYQWALAQPVFNIYASEYVALVLDANKTSIAKIDDGFQINTGNTIRELRIEKTMGLPDLARSKNVIGYNSHHDVYYVHLGPDKQTMLYFTHIASKQPYLISANGRVTVFKQDSDGWLLHLQAYRPLKWQLGNMTGCTLKQKNKILSGSVSGSLVSYQLTKNDSDDLRITCR